MRFLEFVPCGRPARRRAEEEQEAAALGQPPIPRRASAASPHEKRLRRASGAAGSGASSQWRPSLGGISEDGVVRAEEKGGTPSKKTAGRRSAPAARSRDYGDDYRRFTAPAVFPAFSPAAFLF